MYKKITLICLLALTGIKVCAQSYCSPSYPNGCVISNNRITNVQIGTINHSPPDCIVHDYTGISTQIVPGMPTSLTVTSEGWCGVGAAVDLNNDGDFDDPNEIQALPVFNVNQIATYNMNITIPIATPSGNHRLRVYNRMGNSGNGTPQNSPCGAYGYGSWDDYTLYVGLNLGPDTSICEGSILTLNANPGFTYLWSTGATTQTIDVTTSGTYYATIYNSSGTLSDTIQVTVNPLPVVFLGNDISIVSGTSITLNPGNPGASYLWNTGATSQTITVNSAGTYYVTVTNNNDCKAADTIVVTLQPPVGIDDINESSRSLTIYPNPAKDMININIGEANLLKTKVVLNDACGKVIRSAIMETKSQAMSLSGISPGIYILKMENGAVVKMVKEQ